MKTINKLLLWPFGKYLKICPECRSHLLEFVIGESSSNTDKNGNNLLDIIRYYICNSCKTKFKIHDNNTIERASDHAWNNIQKQWKED